MLAKADVCTPLSVMVGLVRHEIAVGAVTLIAELPLLPSEVAVIVADPATSPVTSPLPFTLATAAALTAHVTTRPVSTFPAASFVVAASCTVLLTATLADAGVTVTDATGAVTVMAADPVLPSLVAVTVAVPALTPVTSPVADTVATVGVPEVHVTTRPVSTFPAASTTFTTSGFGSSLPGGPDWRSPLTTCTDTGALGCNGAAACFSQAYTSKPALSSNNALDRGCVRLLMLAMNPPWNEVEPVGTRTGRETLHIACCRVRDLGDAILSGGDT